MVGVIPEPANIRNQFAVVIDERVINRDGAVLGVASAGVVLQDVEPPLFVTGLRDAGCAPRRGEIVMDAGNPIQRIDQVTLTPLVQRALDNATVEVTDWESGLISGGAGSMGIDTSGVYRVSGHGRDQGRTVPWSLILKVAASSAHGGDPDAGAREWHAYQSGLLGDLPSGLMAPRCLGTVAQPDGALWTWLEEISDADGLQWPLARYGLAARHLGQFNGAYLTGQSLPSWPWLSAGWLRSWVAQRAPEIAALRQHREHPVVRLLYPDSITDDVLQLWEERNTFLDALDQLPQTLCHLDAFRRDLLARRAPDGRDQTVAIDWAFMGQAALGEELVPLVLASVAFFAVDLTELQELDQIAFRNYLEGLQDANWRGDPKIVRLGYVAAAALRYTFPISLNLLLDASGVAWLEQVFGRPIGEAVDCWVGVHQFTLGLVDEARALLGALQ